MARRFHAARDAEQFATACNGLAKLVRRGPAGATGQEMFGEAFKGARWGYVLLRRLERDQLVTVERVQLGQFRRPTSLPPGSRTEDKE
jgi:hypothetical protein